MEIRRLAALAGAAAILATACSSSAATSAPGSSADKPVRLPGIAVGAVDRVVPGPEAGGADGNDKCLIRPGKPERVFLHAAHGSSRAIVDHAKSIDLDPLRTPDSAAPKWGCTTNEYARQRISIRIANARYSADPDVGRPAARSVARSGSPGSVRHLAVTAPTELPTIRRLSVPA